MDDVLISDDDYVLRRVPTFLPNFIKPDGSVSSLAFSKKRDEDGLSVDLERLTTPAVTIIDRSRFKLRRINVGIVRNDINDELDVIYNPITHNLAHCLIVGNITGSNKSNC
ncbi:MAG: hypothetical protein WBP08_18375 [Saprospiraceae bacterium]